MKKSGYRLENPVVLADPEINTKARTQPGRKRWKPCCCGCSLLALIPVIPIVMVLMPPPAPPKLTPEQVQTAQVRLKDLRKEVERATKAAQKGEEYSFHLVITEEEMNVALETDNRIKDRIAKHGVHDVFIKVEQGHVRATATVPIKGVEMTLTAKVEPILQSNGRVGMRVSGVDVGRLGIPMETARMYGEKLVGKVNEKALEWNVNIRKIDVLPGKIEVFGNSLDQGATQ
jgi:uncharacterized protein YpmS